MIQAWNGNEFQNYCMMLLQRRYAATNPHALQQVPDQDSGDLGMEAFSLDGAIYQCYAAKEPLTVNACYEKQRDKLTEDLGKLKAKATDVHALLGNLQVSRYVFLVHRRDSRRLITHAQSKVRDILDWKLPFISPTFAIVVETVDDYEAERHALHAIPTPLIEVEPVTMKEHANWVGENPTLTEVADTKLAAVISGSSERHQVLDVLLKQYLEGANALERLRVTLPEAYSALIAARSEQEDLLVLEHSSANPDMKHLTTIADSVAEALREAASVVPKGLARKLAWAAIADWLMRCPLDFGVVNAGR